MTRNWSFHGGRLAAACAAYGGKEADWLDLSTGINPGYWPGANDLRPDWHKLPDEAALAALEAQAARYFGVAAEYCCALPGTELGLRLLGQVINLPAQSLFRTYRTHSEIFDHSRGIVEVDEAALGKQVLILANPNNPDGRITAPADLLRWHERLAAAGGWLVVDEAFADPCPAISIASQVSNERRLIIFRSFGKFFGLAGVRLGFIIAPRSIIAAYRRLLGSWPLSAAAIAIGQAAYGDAAWIARTRVDVPVMATELDRLLARHGYHARGDCPLFRLIETDHAQSLFEQLARKAILTRPFEYDRHWLRLGLPVDAAALARLDEALAHG